MSPPFGPDKKSPISLIRLSGPAEALSSIDERLQMSVERDARVLEVTLMVHYFFIFKFRRQFFFYANLTFFFRYLCRLAE